MRTAAKNMTKKEIEEEINCDFSGVLSCIDHLWEPVMETDPKERLEIVAKFINFMMKANGVKKIDVFTYSLLDFEFGFRFTSNPNWDLGDCQKLLRAFRSVKNRL